MLNNPVKPQAHKIIDILKQTDAEWTFRVENELPIRHGQFMQLSLPKIGEAPISDGSDAPLGDRHFNSA